MKKTIVPLFVALSFATGVFAQEDSSTESTETSAAEAPAAAEETKKEEKKSAFQMDKRPDPVWGIRAGAHLSGITGQTFSIGWHLGGAFYPVKFFDASLGGDVLGVKMLLEPNLLFASKAGFGGTQYWLEAPVMANFMFTVFSFRLKYCVGPYAAVGLFGEFDKIATVSNPAGSKVSRFDVGLNQTFGYEIAKNLWSDISVGMGFIDMVEKEKNSTNFIIKLTAGKDF